MEVETLEFDSFLSNLEQEVQRFGGYLESSSVSGSSIQYTSNRYGTVTVRFHLPSWMPFWIRWAKSVPLLIPTNLLKI